MHIIMIDAHHDDHDWVTFSETINRLNARFGAQLAVLWQLPCEHVGGADDFGRQEGSAYPHEGAY
jgi:hypothetical protein